MCVFGSARREIRLKQSLSVSAATACMRKSIVVMLGDVKRLRLSGPVFVVSR